MEKVFGVDTLVSRSELKEFVRRNDIAGLTNQSSFRNWRLPGPGGPSG